MGAIRTTKALPLRCGETEAGISFTGNNTPVSLFAQISDTTAVSSVTAFSKSANLSNPSWSTGRYVTP